MASEIRANTLKNRVGLGTVTFTNTGPVVSGIVTATSFSGSGAALTGIDATSIKDSGGNVKIQAQASGAVYTGIHTFTTAHATTFVGNVTGNISGGTVAGSTGTFSGDVSITDKIVHTDNTNTAIRFPANGTITFDTNGSERIRIDPSGYVNIGTGSAQQQLTVQNSAQHSLIRVISNTTSDTGVDFGDTADGDIGRIRYSNNGDYMTFRVNNINAVRFDSSGRVQIGGGNTPAQVGDGSLIVYSTDRLHPAIKCAGMENNYANGWTLLGDNYQADESQINLGVSYSSSSLVLSRGVKVSGSADNTYLSSQDSYATRPCAIRMDELGAFNFLTTETNATVATDSAVSLTNVFTIDRVGRIYQRISGRNMHFGASNQLEIGVSSGGDPVINAAGGDTQIKDAGNNICVVRSDGFEMYQGVYPSSNGGADLGKSSRRWNTIYVNDLQLSNKGSQNNVDGTWGDWTLQEGESDVYMINNRSGKKFKIKMEEVI